MAQRSRDNGGVSIYQGRYHRTLGKALNERGEISPKKFLLGTDRRQAEEANCRLERLWGEVVAEHDASVRWMSEIGGLLEETLKGRDPLGRRHLRPVVGCSRPVLNAAFPHPKSPTRPGGRQP